MDIPPPLRPLGVSAPVDDGEQVALFDPLGVSRSAAEGGLLIGVEEWTWAQGFDGRTGVDELAARLGRGAVGEVRPEWIRELAARLSDELLLDDERFDRACAEAFDDFRRNDRRRARGAGREYPEDPFDLRVRLGGVVADDWYMPQLEGALAIWAPSGPLPNAASLYGRAWASVRHAAGGFDRIVVLASAGAPLGQLLVPLAKDFETPLGTLTTDRAALAELGILPGRDQLAHARSRSIERHLLLARLLHPDATVVPLLVGALDADVEPSEDERVEQALEGLARLTAMPGRTLLVAASDLYHLRAPGAGKGPKSGAIGGADRRALDAVEELDAHGFAQIALGEGDPGRASQAAAAYLVLAHLERVDAASHDAGGSGVRVSNLGYLQCPSADLMFTAGAAVFYRELAQ